MKKILLSAAVAASLLLSSCAAIGPVMGFAYTDVKYGTAATSNNLGSKVGRAEAKGYLGVVAIGDASIEAAAKSAGIKKISHVDQHANSILGILTTYTTVVYGE